MTACPRCGLYTCWGQLLPVGGQATKCVDDRVGKPAGQHVIVIVR